MKVSKTVLAIAAGAAVVALLSTPVSAHHSFAMFDRSKTVTIEGTVKEVQWTNPHVWIQILVKDAAGKNVEWSIESISPNYLARIGWKPSSVKAGDRASIVINPLRDGTAGGSLQQISVNGVDLPSMKGK
jgi:hypothetical protein